jgi:diguanylate cyclase (GGDEF)-like protein
MKAIQILLLSMVLISLSFSCANFLGWRLFERPRHALIWAVSYLLAAIQYSFNLFRDQLVSLEIFWLLANSTAFAAVICAVWGHRERLRLPTPGWLMLLVWTVMNLASITSLFILSNQALRTALAPGFTCICMTAIALMLMQHGPRPRLAQNVAAAVHLLFGMTQGAAALFAMRLGEAASPMAAQTYSWVNFSLMPSFFVAMGISVIFLLATDLSYRLRVLALTDSLTQVANRRGFINNSLGALARAHRNGAPLTLILCDIDYFKRINDQYGHSVGDRALQHFARMLLECVRSGDIVGRIGGEEFAICLEAHDISQAEMVAERVRRILAERQLQVDGQPVPLTASYGISTWRDGDDISAMLQRADVALYKAKGAGRDAIHVDSYSLLAFAG